MAAKYSREISEDPADFVVVEWGPNKKSYSIKTANPLPCAISRESENMVTKQYFNSLFDEDGRIINEHQLRQSTFKGGIDPSIREDVWMFLFGYYCFNSTSRERVVLNIDYFSRYHALKNRWKEELQKNQETTEFLRGSYLSEENEPCEELLETLTPDLEMQKTATDIQAKVFAGREKVDVEELKKSIRIVDKDVPRTDRDLEFFCGNDNPNLYRLRDILVTFSAFNPHVGYAQGMNELVARFMVVLNSEVKAYWCFIKYMEKIHTDFMEEGMLRKIKLVRDLLQELDKELLNYLKDCGMDDLMFCHRWLLLGFKREFTQEESYKCFEILSSHHLELSSMEAERIKREQRTKDFEKQDGKCRGADVELNTEYTFELFMCVALLIKHRDTLLECNDPTDIFIAINSLTKKIDLDSILGYAESLFMKYCRKSVRDDFQLVN